MIGVCAHSRAWKYYLESINHDMFEAFQCDSFRNLVNGKCLVIGDHAVEMGGEPGNHM